MTKKELWAMLQSIDKTIDDMYLSRFTDGHDSPPQRQVLDAIRNMATFKVLFDARWPED